MRKMAFHSIVTVAVVGLLGAATLAQAPKPNIIFVMLDDLGYGELGVTGQLARAASNPSLPVIETPHIDALANGGMMFTNAYATPICGSTRGSLYTGMHNGHSSVDSNGLNANGGNQYRDVDPGIGQPLQSVGYTNGAYGKWGAGMDGYSLSPVANSANEVVNHPNPQVTHVGATPIDKGFDEFYGYLNHIHAHRYYVNYLWEHDTDSSEADPRNMQVDWSPTLSDYTADLIADKSVDFISAHAGGADPFMIYAGVTLPHGNFDPPQDAIWQAYIDAGYSTAQANYAAMMARADNHIGEIVDRLKDPNQDTDQSDSVYDDTLIILMSDNGGTGPQMDLFDARAGLKGQKGDVHEGGIKSPFIAHWNGTIAAGSTSDQIVGLVDMFATFADLAGADTPVGLDSQSIADAFAGGTLDEKEYHIFEARVKDDWAIRFGKWKLSRSGSNVLGLYDLDADVGEANNLLNSPTTEQQAIADLLFEIAQDEGVDSDAGTGGAQNTFIIQYKTWAPTNGSTDWADAANWAGGSQFNTRGTAAANFNTGPANNWIPLIENTTGSALETVVSADSHVVAFEVKGTSGQMTVKIENAVSLQANNGARISDGGVVVIDGGSLETTRTVDIRSGGQLIARGDIKPAYDTSGTPLVLKANVINNGTLEIGEAPSGGGGPFAPEATVPVELVANGGFESGTGNPFNAIDDWFSFGGDDAINGRNGTNPASGAFRAIVGFNSSNGATPSPAQDTGHVIALGDEYTFSFAYAAASSWTLGAEQLEATLYYLDGATPVDLFSTVLNPTLNFGTGYNAFNSTLSPVADANAVGKNLLVRFEKFDGDNGFGSVDDVSITIDQDIPDPPAPTNILNIDGDLTQTAGGVMKFDLEGSGGVAGEDYDQLNVTASVSLDGALALTQSGFTPALGDAFAILNSANLAGHFNNAAVSGASITANTSLAVLYEDAGTDGDGDLDNVRLYATYNGDTNGDGVVSLLDLNALGANFGATDATWQRGDFNYDGVVSLLDLNALGANFGNAVPAAPAVPEPASLALLAAGALACLRRRQR